MNPAVGTMWLTRTAVTSKLSAVNAFSSSNAWYANGAEFTVGRRVKSGNTTSLKMWQRKLSSTSESAWIFTGPSWTRPARLSASSGRPLMWSKCACERRTWRILPCSASWSPALTEPASTMQVSLTRNPQVRHSYVPPWPSTMVNSEPWHPRTLMITAVLLFANLLHLQSRRLGSLIVELLQGVFDTGILLDNIEQIGRLQPQHFGIGGREDGRAAGPSH